MNAAAQLVPLDALGDPWAPDHLAGLDRLVRRIFGDGDRPAGWLTRKLRRECVDASLSRLAVRPDGDLQDDDHWLGYVLVGTPQSRGDAVRTAGTGVVASAQGQGVGRRLLDAVAVAVRDAGYARIELFAEATVVPYYTRQGFDEDHRMVTALAFATGHDRALAPARPSPRPYPWKPLEPGEREFVAWLPEAWDGTEPEARSGLHHAEPPGPMTAWLSREGVAWLVQRLVGPEDASLPVLAASLLGRLPAGAPVLLPQLRADSPATQRLLASGFCAAQRGSLMIRPV